MKSVLLKYWKRLSLTGILILAEAAGWILFPLFMGKAIDGIINESYGGLVALTVLGASVLVAGAGRRLYDSRTYGRVYEDLTEKTTNDKKLSTSKKTARVRLLNEMIEFMEESMPELVNSAITLVGTLVIILFLDIQIFIGCVILMLITATVYKLSSNKTIEFNKNYNDELEKQVDTIDAKNKSLFKSHVRKLVRFNINLSDLETLNYSFVMLASIGLIAFSIFTSGKSGLPAGEIFAVVTYVFQLIDGLAQLPIYYQQTLRLSDIGKRVGT